MIVRINSSGNDVSLNIYCNSSDICKIDCQSSNACKNIYLYCFGDCYVNCDDDNGIGCPVFGFYYQWIITNEPSELPTTSPSKYPSKYPTDYPTTISTKVTETTISNLTTTNQLEAQNNTRNDTNFTSTSTLASSVSTTVMDSTDASSTISEDSANNSTQIMSENAMISLVLIISVTILLMFVALLLFVRWQRKHKSEQAMRNLNFQDDDINRVDTLEPQQPKQVVRLPPAPVNPIRPTFTGGNSVILHENDNEQKNKKLRHKSQSRTQSSVNKKQANSEMDSPVSDNSMMSLSAILGDLDDVDYDVILSDFSNIKSNVNSRAKLSKAQSTDISDDADEHDPDDENYDSEELFSEVHEGQTADKDEHEDEDQPRNTQKITGEMDHCDDDHDDSMYDHASDEDDGVLMENENNDLQVSDEFKQTQVNVNEQKTKLRNQVELQPIGRTGAGTQKSQSGVGDDNGDVSVPKKDKVTRRRRKTTRGSRRSTATSVSVNKKRKESKMSIDETNYPEWSQIEVLLWLKMNLLLNGINGNVIKAFYFNLVKEM